MMHILAAVSSAVEEPLWSQLFVALQEELPCSVCQTHLQEWIRAHPDFRPVGIQQYIAQLHNDVNIRRGVVPWTFQQVESVYRTEQQMSLVPLLMPSVAMMQNVTTILQTILASVS
jgi:hypothetical protein